MIALSISVLSVQLLGFFLSLWRTFHGSPASKPTGMRGAVLTLLVYGFFVFAYHRLGVYAPLGWRP